MVLHTFEVQVNPKPKSRPSSRNLVGHVWAFGTRSPDEVGKIEDDGPVLS